MNSVENINQAISVLIQGVQLGLSKGVYNFEEARLIADSIDFFIDKTKNLKESNIEEVINQPNEQENKEIKDV